MRRLLVLAFAAIALVIAACGDDADSPSATPAPTSASSSSTTPLPTNGGIVPPSPEPTQTISYATAATDNERVVALLESGYTAEKGLLSGGVVLHNRNRSESVVVPYTVELVKGGTMSMITQNVVLLPNERVGDAFHQTYTSDQATASIKVSVRLSDAQWVAFDSGDRLTTRPEPVERLTIVGAVDNPFDYDTDGLRLSVLGRDTDGKIVAGQAISVDSIAAHGSGEFEAPAASPLPAEAPLTWETYVSFADDFPAWMTAP